MALSRSGKRQPTILQGEIDCRPLRRLNLFEKAVHVFNFPRMAEAKKTPNPVTHSSHGGFHHKTRPATVDAMLRAYGLKRADLGKVETLVEKAFGRDVAHAG